MRRLRRYGDPKSLHEATLNSLWSSCYGLAETQYKLLLSLPASRQSLVDGSLGLTEHEQMLRQRNYQVAVERELTGPLSAAAELGADPVDAALVSMLSDSTRIAMAQAPAILTGLAAAAAGQPTSPHLARQLEQYRRQVEVMIKFANRRR